jgi:hypothetical protein
VLRANGIDAISAYAGSIIDEPPPARKPGSRIRLAAVLGFLMGIVAVALWRLVYLASFNPRLCLKTDLSVQW